MSNEGKPGVNGKYDVPRYMALARSYIDGGWEEADACPLLEGMARAVGVTPRAIQKWAKSDYGDWREIVAECMDAQRLVLTNGALRNEMNIPTALRILGARHGLSEKTESNVNVNGSVVTRDIPVDMDPVEASRIYRESMRPSED